MGLQEEFKHISDYTGDTVWANLDYLAKVLVVSQHLSIPFLLGYLDWQILQLFHFWVKAAMLGEYVFDSHGQDIKKLGETQGE